MHIFYELGLLMELDSGVEVKTSTNDISSSSSSSITKSFIVPIVFGNLAVALKKPENEHTHRWTVFVRGFNNEDISTFVRKVIFKLHDSFLQPNRVIDKAPYEVTETGWGEFQIQIKIFFHETGVERPVVLTHNLRLYEAGEDLETQIKNGCKPVLTEHYDEIVFDPPPTGLIPVLESTAHLHDPKNSPEAHKKLLESEGKELKKLDEIIKKLESEISSLTK